MYWKQWTPGRKENIFIDKSVTLSELGSCKHGGFTDCGRPEWFFIGLQLVSCLTGTTDKLSAIMSQLCSPFADWSFSSSHQILSGRPEEETSCPQTPAILLLLQQPISSSSSLQSLHPARHPQHRSQTQPGRHSGTSVLFCCYDKLYRALSAVMCHPVYLLNKCFCCSVLPSYMMGC